MLVPVVFALYAWSAAAQTATTYTYTGNPFSLTYCQATFADLYSSCVGGGRVTATITFQNLPARYTGVWDEDGGQNPSSFSMTGNGITNNSSNADFVVESPFQFVNGSLVAWAVDAEVVNVAYNPALFPCGSGAGENPVVPSCFTLTSRIEINNIYSYGDFVWSYSTVPNIVGANHSAGSWALTATSSTPSFQVVTAGVPIATSGQPYNTTFSASGGSGTDYTWSLSSGQLPAGFTLSGTGVLSSTGSPWAPANSYSFAVQVTDSAGNYATQFLTLIVTRQPGTITLLDPVPNLLSGSSVNGSSAAIAATLLSVGTPQVRGVAADGVTELVVQVNGALPNENLVMALYGDGGLANLGSSSFQQVAITLQADSQGNAFALYQAPVDFVSTAGDSSLGFRNDVRLHLYSNDDSSFTADTPVVIVRPLVMLVHGQWADSGDTWGQFSPLLTSPLFTITEGDFATIVSVSSSNPVYNPDLLHAVKGSSLGLDYATPLVVAQLQAYLANYRYGHNQAGVRVAAVQADIVAHSMGGLVARNIAQPAYKTPSTYGAGLIHKLITIDTPHLGTPIATDFLSNDNECVRNLMAANHQIAFQSVAVNGHCCPN